MLRNILFSATIVVLMVGSGARSQEAPVIDAKHRAKPEDVMKLLEATNGVAMGKQVVSRMIEVLSKSSPTVPDTIWAEFENLVSWDSLTLMLVPVYQRYLSKDDIRSLIRFYESSAGKHLIAAQPLILQESMSIGQKMGEEVMTRIVTKLKEKGYDSPVIPH